MNKIFISLLTGVAIGILIAPAKGAETRQKLVDGFNDLTEDLEDNAHDLYSSGKSLLTEVKTDAQNLAAEFKDVTEGTLG